jgi:hypothetical protein
MQNGSCRPGGARVALAGCLLIAACGGSPEAPSSPAASPLSAGRYLLTVNAMSVQGCSSAHAPGTQDFASLVITLTREQSDWVGRSGPRDGDNLVLRFRETPVDSVSFAVTGTIQGTGIVAATPGMAPDLAVSFQNPQPVSGTLPVVSPTIIGRINGPAVFIDTQQRGPRTCPAADWILSPLAL